MRSIPLLSAALCGVLWISLSVDSVAAQIPHGVIGITSSTTISSTTVNVTTTPETPTFETPTSSAVSSATPAVGAAVGAADTSNTSNSKNGSTTPHMAAKKSSNAGPIIGGVIGGIVALALILGAAFYLWRRRRRAVSNTEDFGVLEKQRASSPSVYPVTGISTYNTPSPAPQLSPVPPITSVESHHLMDGYPEPGRLSSAEIFPVVGATKPYTVNTQRELDDDGVSLRSPSPVQDGGNPSGGRDSVPRLPIYNRGGGDTTDRGPAL